MHHLAYANELREAREDVGRSTSAQVAAERAVEWLRAGRDVADAYTPQARADVLHPVCDRIVVKGREIVSVRLT